MSKKNIIQEMRNWLNQAKEQGIHTISCDILISWLERFEHHDFTTTEFDIERYKADLQEKNCFYQFHHESNLEVFRSVILAGQNAIKTSFLLNGSAAVALLAFISHLAQFSPEKVSDFTKSILPFTIGVFLTAANSGLTYFSQWCYAGNKTKIKWGYRLNLICIALGICSYVAFIWGLSVAYRAFINF